MSDEKSGENGNEALSKPLRRWRKAGDLDDLRMRVWRALRAAEQVMYDESSTRTEVLRAANAIGQLSRSYTHVLDAGDLDERLTALEKWMQENKAHGQAYLN